MTRAHGAPRNAWAYRVLLRLYPASYRLEFQSELERTYEELVRERGTVGAMIAAVADVVPNAFAVHRDILVQDLKYTARTLGRARGFALATILVTALGVGANTATFSLADFALLNNLPFADPASIVRICEGPKDNSGWGCMNQLSPANWRDVRNSATSFTPIAAFTGGGVNLAGNGEPVRVSAQYVTPDLFPVLGVRPMIGRTFDSTAADLRTMVISYGLWQSQFGGDYGVVGAAVNVGDLPYRVIGVMPASFRFPSANDQVWMPLGLQPQDFEQRGNTYLDAVTRLKPGVTFEQGRAELQSIFERMRRDIPDNSETGFS